MPKLTDDTLALYFDRYDPDDWTAGSAGRGDCSVALCGDEPRWQTDNRAYCETHARRYIRQKAEGQPFTLSLSWKEVATLRKVLAERERENRRQDTYDDEAYHVVNILKKIDRMPPVAASLEAE